MPRLRRSRRDIFVQVVVESAKGQTRYVQLSAAWEQLRLVADMLALPLMFQTELKGMSLPLRAR